MDYALYKIEYDREYDDCYDYYVCRVSGVEKPEHAAFVYLKSVSNANVEFPAKLESFSVMPVPGGCRVSIEVYYKDPDSGKRKSKILDIVVREDNRESFTDLIKVTDDELSKLPT